MFLLGGPSLISVLMKRKTSLGGPGLFRSLSQMTTSLLVLA